MGFAKRASSFWIPGYGRTANPARTNSAQTVARTKRVLRSFTGKAGLRIFPGQPTVYVSRSVTYGANWTPGNTEPDSAGNPRSRCFRNDLLRLRRYGRDVAGHCGGSGGNPAIG